MPPNMGYCYPMQMGYDPRFAYGYPSPGMSNNSVSNLNNGNKTDLGSNNKGSSNVPSTNTYHNKKY